MGELQFFRVFPSTPQCPVSTPQFSRLSDAFSTEGSMQMEKLGCRMRPWSSLALGFSKSVSLELDAPLFSVLSGAFRASLRGVTARGGAAGPESWQEAEEGGSCLS